MKCELLVKWLQRSVVLDVFGLRIDIPPLLLVQALLLFQVFISKELQGIKTWRQDNEREILLISES